MRKMSGAVAEKGSTTSGDFLKSRPVVVKQNQNKPEKSQAAGVGGGVRRKALSDITNFTNTGLHLQETRKMKKIGQSKRQLAILAEAEEGSPEPIDCHNHGECMCIKAQQRSFLDDFSDASAEPMSPPCLTPLPQVKPEWLILKIKSPPSPELELEEPFHHFHWVDFRLKPIS